MQNSDHLKGILLTTAGVIILSPDAILMRLLNADTWTILFWRGITFSTGITLLMLLMYRRGTIQQFIKIGKPGVIIGIIFSLSTLCFTVAIQNTSISNTLVIISTSPMFGALFSWIFLKEKIKIITWVAMVIIFVATATIMYNSFASGGLVGDISAFGTSIFMATTFTIMRRYKEVNMVPAMAISGIAATLMAIPLIIASTSSFLLTANAIPYLIATGILVHIAFALITLGPRYMPAPEVGLIMPLETVLGSYLGWLFLKEQPSELTLIGGILVIATLIIHTSLSLKKTN